MRKYKALAYTVLLSFLLSASAQAQVLYGAANGVTGGFATSSLYEIDQNTGNATLIGQLGFNNVTGMAFLPNGRLVMSANGDDLCLLGGDLNACAVLLQLNIATGRLSLVGIMGDDKTTCGRFPDMTYDAATDTLYAYGDFCEGGPEGLYTVNTATGLATPVGEPSGFSSGGNGLAVDPSDWTIYGTPRDDNCLVVLDPVTGAGICVPGSGGNILETTNALDFAPNGTLYGSLKDDNDNFDPDVLSYLVTIDTADGTTSLVGQSALGLDAIAFGPPGIFIIPGLSRPIPTLSEWGLIAMAGILGVVGFMVIRRRKVTT